MKPAAWLLLLFVLSGGISALLGNELGRKIGKKKLTLFSLRPKHTSTFMTVVLSMALSAGLFSLFLLVSPQDRQVLLNPDELVIAQMESQEQRLAEINQTLKRWKRAPKAALAQKNPDSTASVTPNPRASSESEIPAAQAPPPQDLRLASGTEVPAAPLSGKVRRRGFEPAASWEDDLNWERELEQAPPRRLQPTPTDNPVRFEKRPSQGRSEQAQYAQAQPSQRQQWILARAQETLLRFETPPSQSPQQAEATVAKILELTEAYAQQMGLPPSEGSRVQVLVAEVQALKNSLLSDNELEIEVETAQNVQASQPLRIHLHSTPLARLESDWDPAEILEEERLQPDNVKTALKKDVLPAIRSALSLKTPFYAELPPQSDLSSPAQPFVSAARLGFSGSQNVKIMDTLLDAESLKIRLWMLP